MKLDGKYNNEIISSEKLINGYFKKFVKFVHY